MNRPLLLKYRELEYVNAKPTARFLHYALAKVRRTATHDTLSTHGKSLVIHDGRTIDKTKRVVLTCDILCATSGYFRFCAWAA